MKSYIFYPKVYIDKNKQDSSIFEDNYDSYIQLDLDDNKTIITDNNNKDNNKFCFISKDYFNITNNCIYKFNSRFFIFKILISAFNLNYDNKRTNVENYKGLECLVKEMNNDNNMQWNKHKIIKNKGNYFILSDSDIIYSACDVFIIEKTIIVDASKDISIVNLPISLSTTVFKTKVNEFSNSRLKKLISKIEQYSKLYTYYINKSRTKLFLIGDCDRISEDINNHYELINSYNAKNNLFELQVNTDIELNSKEIIKSLDLTNKPNNLENNTIKESSNNKENENNRLNKIYKETIILEKKLYDIVKPKIDQIKKKLKKKKDLSLEKNLNNKNKHFNLMFDIKNIKDNKIKIEITSKYAKELEEVLLEINIKQDYFEILLDTNNSFVSSNNCPSLDYYKKNNDKLFCFNLFEFNKIDSNRTAVEIIGSVKSIEKFKLLLKMFFDLNNELNCINKNISEINKDNIIYSRKYNIDSY